MDIGTFKPEAQRSPPRAQRCGPARPRPRSTALNADSDVSIALRAQAICLDTLSHEESV